MERERGETVGEASNSVCRRYLPCSQHSFTGIQSRTEQSPPDEPSRYSATAPDRRPPSTSQRPAAHPALIAGVPFKQPTIDTPHLIIRCTARATSVTLKPKGHRTSGHLPRVKPNPRAVRRVRAVRALNPARVIRQGSKRINSSSCASCDRA